MSKYGQALFASAGVATSVVTAQPAAAQMVQFAIPAQPVEAAVLEFGRQAQIQIAVSASAANHQITRPVYGRLDVKQALAQMLTGTNLQIVFSDARMIALDRVKTPPTPKVRIVDSVHPAPASEPAANTETIGGDLLSEIVVTATRRPDLVSRVPLAVTAVTQEFIDLAGIKSTQDLARNVPELTFRNLGGDSDPQVSIRGIASSQGAPTTGVYLDEAPLSKRGTQGVVTGKGTTLPLLFDTQRVEVLRGPQGTLFGSGSEGGAIRYITPDPSLTRVSFYGRSEVSTTEGGDPSYEGGVAGGGPIIPDRLGFRASVWARHAGGYLDHVSIYDASTIGANTNFSDQKQARLAVAWQPTDQLKVTSSIYYSYDHRNDADNWWRNVPQFTINPGIFTNAVHFGPAAPGGFTFKFPDYAFAGGTFGPWNQFGPFKTPTAIYYQNGAAITGQLINSPRTSSLAIPSLTIDYDAGWATIKSITSFTNDTSKGTVNGQSGSRINGFNGTTAGYVIPGSITASNPAGVPVPGGWGPVNPILFSGYPTLISSFQYKNVRNAVVQEMRFSSLAGSKSRLSWVGGVFYSSGTQTQPGYQESNEGQVVQFVRGVDEAWFQSVAAAGGGSTFMYQVPFTVTGGPTLAGGAPTYNVAQNGQTQFNDQEISYRLAKIYEEELAGYANVNYAITAKLKVIAGVRISQLRTHYYQLEEAPVYGAPPQFVPTVRVPLPNTIPTAQLLVDGRVSETPITPTFGLSYQASNADLFYATVSKGYRPGSVNAAAAAASCGQYFALLPGGTSPPEYRADTVWSYEGGAKVRLFGGRAQINSSIFYIDWQGPQLTVQLPCGFSYVTNASEAASRGADVEFQWRVGGGLTVAGSVAYDDATYTRDYSFAIPGGGRTYIVRKGDGLGTPNWQASISGIYEKALWNGYRGYLRGQFDYSGRYLNGAQPGDLGYNPVSAVMPETRFASFRTGLTHGAWDASLFVNNLTDSRDLTAIGSLNTNPSVTSQTFRPREVGLQLIVRY